MKRFLICLALAAVLLCFMTVSVSAENVTWSVDAEGTLNISGTGAMVDYASAATAPWAAEDIYAVVVEEGVSYVGKYAFSGLFLDNVQLPESLTGIGENAFDGTGVVEAHFAGNLKQWRENVTVHSGNDSLTDVLVIDKDVTYGGEGFSLANGVVTSYVETLPLSFIREYNDYVFEVSFVDVTAIGDFACGNYMSYYALTNIRSVSIPEGVTSIGFAAFENCTSLESVSFPSTLRRICGKQEEPVLGAFSYCTGLKSLQINEGCTTIDAWVFYDCSGLTSVSLPDTLTSIGEEAFNGCSSLTSITIPDGITSIENNTFAGCSSLTSVSLPDTLTKIAYFAFEGCTSLTNVIIPDGVTNIENSAFRNCSSLTSVTLSNGLTGISEGVFSFCSSLTTIAIPNNVTSIGRSAFYGCRSLTSVAIPVGVASIGDSAFFDCTSLTSVTIPASVTGIGDSAFCHSGLTDTAIPDSVTSIGCSAFSRCPNLTSVSLPSGLTSIEAAMFNDSRSLKNVMIPGSVTSIGENAFLFDNGCSLTDVYFDGDRMMWDNITLGSNNNQLLSATLHPAVASGDTGDCRWVLRETGLLKIIGQGRMADYLDTGGPWWDYSDQITQLNVGMGVRRIGNYAFIGLTDLQTVTGMVGVTNIGTFAFSGCTSLEGLTIPGTVTSMGDSVFTDCTLLTSAGPVGSNSAIEFGWTKAIPANAFAGANCLEALTIPEGVTRIMASAAEGCTELTEVTLPTSLLNIQQNAFEGCSALPVITLPNGLKTIGNYAFAYCGELTEIAIPDSCTSIGDSAFSNCRKLASADLGEGLVSIGESAFTATGLTSIVIPDSVTTIGLAPFEGCNDLTVMTCPVNAACTDLCATALVTLTLSGTGDMMDYSAAVPAPWYSSNGTLETVVVGPDVTSVGSFAFADLGNLASVDLGIVISIGSNAFHNTSLTELTVPASLISFANDAFSGCADLATVKTGDLAGWLSVDFANGAANPLSNGAALYVSGVKLTELTVPSEAAVKPYAFYGCCDLTVVIFPGSVPEISEDAFADCADLADVYFQNTQDVWGNVNHAGATGYSNAHVHVLVHHARVEPTCGVDGSIEYWNCTACGDLLSEADHFSATLTAADIMIPMLAHDWNEPTYEWSADNKTVTATRTCRNDVGKLHPETETVNTTSVVKTAATCEGMGTTTYTAAFSNPAFAAQTRDAEDIPALGHDWCEWELTTETTETAAGTESRTCKNDASHTETRTVWAIVLRTDEHGAVSASADYAAAGMEISVNAEPAEGWLFDGWTVLTEGLAVTDGEFTMPEAPVILEARWSRIPTAILSVENVLADGSPAIRAVIRCGADESQTVFAARYDADGRLLSVETMALQAGENTFTVLRQGAAQVCFFVLNSATWAPACEAADAPVPIPLE